MLTKDFYNIIDKELEQIIVENKNDEFIKKYHKSVDNQKSYALLIWLLQFYRKANGYFNSITDGNNDKSCDIVFERQNNKGEKIFYIVQSKWNSEKNSEKETNKDEILKALAEFSTILKGEKLNVNEKLKERLKDLDVHLKVNGEVKFIFLSLANYKGGADDDIKAFIKSHPKTQFEVVDIERLKLDYIDRNYKDISPINPLEKQENAESSPISLLIERLNKNGGNIIKIEKPFDAYIFLLRPKMIHELFEKFNFGLFFKNVRNPLLESQFNEQIEKTAVDNPAFFWYYNNGITGITRFMPDEIRNEAVSIPLTGLQIINGAQTVYAIYRAYENASEVKRLELDTQMLISLRLFQSGGTDFDLNVTRFTNSQNPVTDRDFHANDEVQIRLQEESFNTKVWYEKRQDEFRVLPEGVEKVSNETFIAPYLAFHLQDPESIIKDEKNNKELYFLTQKENKNGIYEKIFNEKTFFKDMLCSLYLSFLLDSLLDEHQYPHYYDDYFTLAAFREVYSRYIVLKYPESGEKKISINEFILKNIDKEKTEILKVLNFTKNFINKMKESDRQKDKFKILEHIQHDSNAKIYRIIKYDEIKKKAERIDITLEQIESIQL